MEKPRPVIVGLTGASGAVLAKRCVELLIAGGERPIIVRTDASREVWRQEIGRPFDEWLANAGGIALDIRDIAAPIASGTFDTKGMIVIPCSMGTAAALAHGLSSNLLQRAADVTMKEGRRLVIVPRESPLSVIHLTNLLTLAQVGVKIVLPVPAFYTRPQTLDDVVDAIVGRALSALGVSGYPRSQDRYGGEASRE